MIELLVPFGFYLLTGLMIYSLPVLMKPSKALFNRKRKTTRYFMYGFVTWFLYLSGLSNNGFLNNFELPPRLPILVIIPVVFILFWYASRPYLLKTIKTVPYHYFVYIQSFRVIVELLIWGCFLMGVLPEVVTFEGLNFDIYVGFSALIVGFLAQQNKISKKGLLIWNWAGIAVLLFTVFQFVDYYFIGDFEPDKFSGQFVKLPYLFLPAVLMPLALFYHMVSIRQLNQEN
ncbi:MAG: hypothetical protein ACPGEG_00130 [Salibacteraceae bacterium]